MSAPVRRLVLRARQIKALYQRELTALHRDPAVAPDELPEREAALRRQAAAKLAELRQEAERHGSLSDEERAAFATPDRPHPRQAPPLSRPLSRGDARCPAGERGED